MKLSRLVIFLSVVFTIYGLVSYYIYSSGMAALDVFAPAWLIVVFKVLFIFLVFSYPVARMAGKWIPAKIADFLAFFGGLWFAAMLYFTIILITTDLISLIIGFIPDITEFTSAHSILINAVFFLASVSLVSILIFSGYLNAISPRVKNINIHVSKQVEDVKQLNIAFASDIHLGHVIGKKSLKKIVHGLNAMNPDLVLFPGDIVDEELKPVIDKNLGELFKSLKPKYGVFAVTGNHEYIGGAEQAVNYLSKFGIRFLRDETVNIANAFYIAGREDISITSFYGKKRKTVAELLNNTDPKLPVIMMDHQPIALSEASENGVDLQVSGHTHHGQMWPLHLITKRVFKLSWGYMKINNSHFYVSSGAGSWGPRVRVGNHPEIVLINMKFGDS